MMKPVLLALFLWLCFYPLAAQLGCTDPLASNYNQAATINNGSCIYSPTNYTLPHGIPLSTQVNETSGLVYVNGDLWTFNDTESTASLYKINPTTGQIVQTVLISNASNVDWEDITADDEYIYIGDFGNNFNGNRQDLKIYKIRIDGLYSDPVLSINAETIKFSYVDQTDFSPRGNNNTEFDCEAFFVKNNQLHLFTKDWIGPNDQDYQTKHYTLSTTPGTYTAVFKEAIPVGGSITGADISRDNDNEIVLIGYHPTNGSLFMWLLFDYSNDFFFNGNKRKIGLGSAAQKGQIEGVTYVGNGSGYISSERFSRTVFGITFTIPASLYTFTSVNWVPLPVDLLNFTATYAAPDIYIVWQTASETESDYFAVERSSNGISFEEIYRQPAAGISKSLLSYRFTDRSASQGENYYRLKLQDKDGKFTYSSIQTVEVERVHMLMVNSVPVRRGEMLNLEYNGSSGNVNISLRDINGYTWFHKDYLSSATQQLTLETAHLKPGMYILQLIDSQEVLTKRILIL